MHVADGLRLPKLLCCENNTQIRPITVSFSGSVIDKLEQKMNVLWKLFISLKRSLKDALCCVLKFLKHYNAKAINILSITAGCREYRLFVAHNS